MNKNSLKIAFGWGPGHTCMTLRYTWGSMTKLHDLGGVLGRPLDTFILGSHNFVVTDLALVWSGPEVLSPRFAGSRNHDPVHATKIHASTFRLLTLSILACVSIWTVSCHGLTICQAFLCRCILYVWIVKVVEILGSTFSYSAFPCFLSVSLYLTYRRLIAC